tara:strand:- start:4321 stop:6270 length:1950 start_codon:yes stop_codon:yes gene_type:complete
MKITNLSSYQSRLIFIIFILCLFFPYEVHSFSLKGVKVKSSFGDKFYAEVIVNNDSKKGLKVSIGSPQDYALLRVNRSKVVDELRIQYPIEFVSSNQQLIRIVSDKPLFYPSFDLIVKASLEGGIILEKYSLAVDFKKNMSIALSPPSVKEKTVPRKTAKTPTLMQEKKKTEPPPSPKVEKPKKPKVMVKRKVKEPIAAEKAGVSTERKTEEKVLKRKPAKLKKTAIVAKVKVKKTGEVPKITEKKLDSTNKKTSTESLFTYTVASGDTLSGILKKVKPQKGNLFYKTLVTLWKLNENKFMHGNMNGLKIGTRLSFDNLDEEVGKISTKQAFQILGEQWAEWKDIRAGTRKKKKVEKKLILRAAPLPGENVLVTNDILVILSGWKQSWENKDMEKHFSYYSDDFSSENYLKKNIDREGWKQYKSGIVEKNENIKVNIKSLHIRKEGNQVIASFLQKFSSENLLSFGTKNITFAEEGEQWKIKKELFQKQKTEILSSKFSFVVQTSSYKKWALAMKKANSLRKTGFAAYIVKSSGDSEVLRFRVVIGRFRARTDAYHFAQRLVQSKYTGHATVQKLPYAISLGSLKNEAEAYETIQSFRKKRYSPYLFSIGDEKEVIHHVLVGGYKNQKRVNKVSGDLSEQGIPHMIIQP